MFRVKFLLLAIVGFVLTATAQKAAGNLNDYKYVIVPVKYEFLKEADKYQLNSLTRFLFEKYGFTAFMENGDFPEDYKKNNCLALKAEVISDNNLFKTKLKVQLKNCEGHVLYTTKVGETREKDLKTAYNLALREAFTSFEAVNYKYEPNQKFNRQEPAENATVADHTQAEIEKLKAEIKELKSEHSKPQEAAQPTPNVATVTVPEQEKPASSNEVLYAQATDNGYQLVDSTPKVVYRLMKTGTDSIFLVETVNGVLTKKETNWILEYYEDDKLIQKTLSIKF